MQKRDFLVLGASSLVLAACGTIDSTTTRGGQTADPQARRKAIDSAVDAALSRLNSQVPGASQTVSRARGILVFPSVVSAGLTVGGSYGEGALRTAGKSAGYY